jgi:hypothetical protein
MVPTNFLLLVNVNRQMVFLFERSRRRHCAGQVAQQQGLAARATRPAFIRRHYELIDAFRCSTSKFGIGQQEGSNCTPLGWHRVAKKIGGGWPVGTVFKGRQPIGFTWCGLPLAKITTRILWLEGFEPGFNRGGNVDSFARYIYIHGTGDEPTLGRPASHGCVHLAADDLIPLYDKLPAGTLVWIAER